MRKNVKHPTDWTVRITLHGELKRFKMQGHVGPQMELIKIIMTITTIRIIGTIYCAEILNSHDLISSLQ